MKRNRKDKQNKRIQLGEAWLAFVEAIKKKKKGIYHEHANEEAEPKVPNWLK